MAIDVTPYREVHKLLTTPEADRLAELYLIRGDLKAAHQTLSLYFERFTFSEIPKSADDATIACSLFRDGIGIFSACFSTRDPDKLNPEAVFGHIKGWESYCKKILDIRDSFVAHNFGPQRQYHVNVIALEIDGALIPAAFNESSVRFAGWMASEGKQLLQYVDVALEHVENRIEEAERPVREMLQAITPEELAALPDAVVKIPEHTDYRTTRAKFRESGRGQPQPLPERRWIQTVEGELERRCSDQSHEGPDEEAPPLEPEPNR